MSEDAPMEHLRRLVASGAGKRDSFDATNNWNNPPGIMFSNPINRTMDAKPREITQQEFPGFPLGAVAINSNTDAQQSNMEPRIELPEGYIGMSHSHIYGYDWNSCSLCRASRQALDTLNRAVRRRVDWSEIPLPSQEDPLSECPPVTGSEALQSVVQLLEETARTCQSYHRGATRSLPCSPLSERDSQHLRRYHTPQTLVTSHRTWQGTILSVDLPTGQYSLERVPCPLTGSPADKHVIINFSL